MRYYWPAGLMAFILFGCAQSSQNPVIPKKPPPVNQIPEASSYIISLNDDSPPVISAGSSLSVIVSLNTQGRNDPGAKEKIVYSSSELAMDNEVITDDFGKAKIFIKEIKKAGDFFLEIGNQKSVSSVLLKKIIVPSDPYSIEIISGDFQIGEPGARLTNIKVKLTDIYSNPIQNLDVFWDTNDGFINNNKTVTNIDGMSEVEFRLPHTTGPKQLRAYNLDLVGKSEVTFNVISFLEQVGTPQPPQVDPTQVYSAFYSKDISSGSDYSCSVEISGDVFCWGDNRYFQLGNSLALGSASPKKITSTLKFDEVKTSNYYINKVTCAKTQENKLYCFGDNSDLRLSPFSGENSVEPLLVSDSVVDFSLGGQHSCYLNNLSELYCIGNNYYSQLGDGTNISRGTFVRVSPEIKFNSISSGRFHTCAIDKDFFAYCWGNNDYGQLGTGDKIQKFVPTKIFSEKKFSKISAGENHTCAIEMYSNYVFCWGDNFYGQLGDSSLDLNRSRPSLISGYEAKDISVNGTQSCLIEQVTSDLFCWGNNFTGALGSTNLAYINNPTLVSSEINFKKISVGTNHICGIDDLDQTYCFGDNYFGQIGLGYRNGVIYYPESVILKLK